MLMVIGARGWEHKKWNGSFYEDLLPEDWHLKFYSSNFGAALAPYAFWVNASKDEIEEFCDDISDDYPLVFELPENISDKNSAAHEMANELIPTWVTFSADAWVKKESTYTITQATVVKSGKLREKSAVFKVTSNLLITDAEIKQLMLSIKTEFKPEYDVVYVFFDGALIEIDTMNTAVTLLKILVLDY